ncbi:MAG: hypothetical protein EA396_06850 [Anaerolineaceae bacterium]|nr:MAG: hypothetical protein EA396_06850 [Anaerolineaceae bacterium]
MEQQHKQRKGGRNHTIGLWDGQHIISACLCIMLSFPDRSRWREYNKVRPPSQAVASTEEWPPRLCFNASQPQTAKMTGGAFLTLDIVVGILIFCRD